MKNWIKEKLRNWLFKEEMTVTHRVINVPSEIITLRSRHQIPTLELDEMVRSGRLTKDAAIQLIQNEASNNLLEQLKDGGFIETTHFTSGNYMYTNPGTEEIIELKLTVAKPKF